MKTIKTITVISLACLATFLIACGNRNPKLIQTDPEFGKYISGYTSGMISKKGSIRIELADSSLKDINYKDSILLKELFEFEPAIKGQAQWLEDNIIEFIPEDNLNTGQFYNGTFHLEKVAVVKSGYENFPFQFATYTQHIYIDNVELRDYYDGNVELKHLYGNIRTTDVADSAELIKTLNASFKGKTLAIELNKAYDDNTYSFSIDSINRQNETQSLTFKWNGKPIQSLSRGKKEIEVPALGDFELTETKVVDKDDQVIELIFSESISPEQDLEGLITLENVEALKFEVDYNKISVFLPHRLLGRKTLNVHKGIQNIKGYGIKKGFEKVLTFEEPKPRIKLIGNGNILPNSQGLIFPFESIALKSIDVRIIKIFEHNIHHFLQVNDLDGSDELTRFGKIVKEKKIFLNVEKNKSYQWTKHVIDLNKLIKPDPGSVYRISIKYNKEDASCDCPKEEEEDEEDAEEQEEDPNWNERLWHTWGFEGYDDYGYDYYENYDACSDDYYYGKAISRNILASDLGLMFKLDEDKTGHVFVNDLLTTAPLQGVKVEFYTYAKELIHAGETNAEGKYQLKLNQKPFLLVAKKGQQRGYLKLWDWNANSLNKFDIEGDKIRTGIKGFIYGERGVWRPGDSLYLNFMLGDKFKKLPKNYPVLFQLQNPNGEVIYEITKTKNVGGIYDFRTKTESDAMTGNYIALAKIGNQEFTKTIKIETVKPNRLKIKFEIDENSLSDSLGSLYAQWLHGAKAKSLKTTINVGYQATKTKFTAYKNYDFDSPLRTFKSNAETVFDGELDKDGFAKPNIKINNNFLAPGKLNAVYVVKVFEKSGDFSIDRFQTLYSPYQTYIGIKSPDMQEYDPSLLTDQWHSFEFVSLDKNGKIKTDQEINVKIYKLNWRWWYEKDEEDLMQFVSRNGTIAIKDSNLSLKNGKVNFKYKVRNEQYGRYLIVATDSKGNHQTGKIINFDLPYWSRGHRTETEQAKMLNFSCDKSNYQIGEKVKISFPSPAAGRALVSVESSTKIVETYWVTTKQGETNFEFTATQKMAPGCYIHLTMIQSHISTKNDLPLRMYGVLPIQIDDPSSHLQPQILTKDVFKPEQKERIQIKEKNGRRMVYTLAIVDEGLLDLTRFQTPKPWPIFYPKEALGVKTWDMYDQVIGAYAGTLTNVIGIGGDGGLDAGAGPKANRFKPMVCHLGPFILEAGATKNHVIDIPNYIGSVRVMVVAHNEDMAYGQTEKAVFVRKPLMGLMSLPRVLNPEIEFDLPVTIFAMEEKMKNVVVQIETSSGIELKEGSKKSLTFTEIGDQIAYFRIKVKSKIGLATIKMKAEGNGEKCSEVIEIDIQHANPIIKESEFFTLEQQNTKAFSMKKIGLKGTNHMVIEVSNKPAIGIDRRLDYLIRYPHGCIEQTTSGAFPQIYLAQLVDLNAKNAQKSSYHVEKTLLKLKQFQTSEGGFAYWPGENEANDWGTNYAGHFMLEAIAQGYKVDQTMLNKWEDYQINKAKKWEGENGDLTQAYRLFVLALSKKPQIGAMNRLKEENKISEISKIQLAAAYHLAGQREIAQKMLSFQKVTTKNYRELSGTFGSDLRDKSIVIYALSVMGEYKKASTYYNELVDQLKSDQWLSTQETGYGLLAVCKYNNLQNGKTGFEFEVTNGKELTKYQSKKGIYQLKITEDQVKSNGALKINGLGSKKLYVSLSYYGVQKYEEKKSISKSVKMSIQFKDSELKNIKVNKMAQGTEFTMQITLKNLGNKHLKEMALTNLVPSGWEILNNRLDGYLENGQARYQDIKDNGVLSYYELNPYEEKTIQIRLLATYKGKFYLPGSFTEAMYDNAIQASNPGKWIVIY